MRHRLTFEVQYEKWYLVDMTNYHNPVLVRKHLITKKQAKTFRDNHYPNFEVLQGKEAIKLNIKDWHNGKPKHRHRNVSKYEFPDRIKTQNQRKIYRGYRRRTMKNNPPKLTYDIVKDILKGKPIFFITKKVTKFYGNHWVMSEPVPGYKKIIEKSKDWRDRQVMSNICRALMKYYDCGIYRETDVAIDIFDYWGDLSKKYFGGKKDIPTDEDKVIKELKARGFVKWKKSGLSKFNNYIYTIRLDLTLYYPEPAWHSVMEKVKYDSYIYDSKFMGIGIPGYCGLNVVGLASRK